MLNSFDELVMHDSLLLSVVVELVVDSSVVAELVMDDSLRLSVVVVELVMDDSLILSVVVTATKGVGYIN